jgi:hypothetical protein
MKRKMRPEASKGLELNRQCLAERTVGQRKSGTISSFTVTLISATVLLLDGWLVVAAFRQLHHFQQYVSIWMQLAYLVS